MNYKERRNSLYERLENEGILILCSGFEVHRSADECYPFSVNRNFYYLTGIEQKNSFLFVDLKTKKETLLLLDTDVKLARWIGSYLSFEEGKKISFVDEVISNKKLEEYLTKLKEENKVYLDLEKITDLGGIHYGEYFTKLVLDQNPHLEVNDVYPFILALRGKKDDDEIQMIRKAISLTNEALKAVLLALPNLHNEREVQALFEERIMALGKGTPAFDTIAGSGKNSTTLHYHENKMVLNKEDIILLDLGARIDYYNADISRTYPISGTYSPLQRKIYNIVLKANENMMRLAKPGVSMNELQQKTIDFLASECLKEHLIDNYDEIHEVYFHRVSHHLGIDVHDPMGRETILEVGNVISDEPGLYFEKLGIGVRIEDDLLITEDGCENLSKEILKDPDEIEKFMKMGK